MLPTNHLRQAAAPEPAPAVWAACAGLGSSAAALRESSTRSHSLWSEAQQPTHPRRCARGRTSARSPCCSTAMPSLRRARSALHSSSEIPSVLSLPGILPLLPHRREVALPIFGGSCRRWMVTGDRAKDGQGS